MEMAGRRQAVTVDVEVYGRQEKIPKRIKSFIPAMRDEAFLNLDVYGMGFFFRP